ncbi:MAG TPA: FecR domain-containing protein [Stellaceae bacterium]|nr:FecR domain-containing protein [Stellaceae bacterium]
METSHMPANGDTPRKASEWLVALNEEPDDTALRARFDAWLAENPAHAAEWAEMTRTFDVLRRLEPEHQQEWGAFAEGRQAEHSPSYKDMPVSVGRPTAISGSPPRFRRRLVLGAAAAAIAACLVLVAGPNLVLRLQADHLTGTAEERTVQLADGSTVRLAPESAIDVAYGATDRHVRLLKGEAFFEVAHDAARPFTVEAGGVETTDLGTAFDVRLEADETDIAVRQGLVRVDAPTVQPALSERLAAGQWLRIAHGQAERGDLAPEEIGAWTHGQLIAKNRPVAEIVNELRPYYHGVILLRGAALARQPLTGVYNLSDPVEALRAVARAQGATVYRLSPWILIISGS